MLHTRSFRLLTALLLLPVLGFSFTDSQKNRLLQELDKQLELAPTYDANHLQRLNALKSVARNPQVTPSQRYGFYRQLIDEYKAFNYDSTLFYIDESRRLARQLNDRRLVDEASIRQGFLFATGGNFLEASDVLYNELDSTTLDPALLPDYYTALQRLASELAVYTTDSTLARTSASRRDYYLERLLECLDPQSDEALYTRLQTALAQENFALADSLSLVLTGRHPASSHKYAIYAYFRSVLFDYQGDTPRQMEWLARSAIADIKSSVKDYASLCRLATVLFDTDDDVERAFHYIDVSMRDAMSYNAKLRPWQVASILPQIEKAYIDKQNAQAERFKLFIIIISALLVLSGTAVVFLILQTQKTNQAQKDTFELNERLVIQKNELANAYSQQQILTRQITDANRVKEEYISLFLGILSDNIDQMKEFRANVKRKIRAGHLAELTDDLSNVEQNEAEVASFYKMFDSAFLELYPHFVDEFNKLLIPEERFDLKKGELLNTELRIFALIRLGISDSGKIATLLRYSVNTIYNYRAKIKNNALGSRDTFEDQVKHIGA